jgi:uroporphyrinogen III methyltransferase/synthase
MPETRRAARTPLGGRGVAITHSEAAPGRLERRLAALGATVHRWSAVSIVEPRNPEPLDAALADLSVYDWLVFASPHAAESVAARCAAPALRPRVAAVGRATAASLTQLGWPVDLVPREFSAAGLVAAFAAAGEAQSTHILLPESAIARAELSAGLTALGAAVERVVAYETVPRALDRAALDTCRVDAVTFASPSAAAALAAALGDDSWRALPSRAAIVAIGPTTARALADRGATPDAIAEPHTFDGLAAAVVDALARRDSLPSNSGPRPERPAPHPSVVALIGG